LRSTSVANANKFGIDPSVVDKIKKERQEDSVVKKAPVCPRDPALREACLSCSS
jgi:hypothetical protein